MKEWGLQEALYNQRAIREYTDEPVSEEDIQFLLDTAVKAPSGGNRQSWAFLIIREMETKIKIRDFFLKSFEAYQGRVRALAEKGLPEAIRQVERWSKNPNMGDYQRNFHKIPLMLMILADERSSSDVHTGSPVMAMNSLYGSIFPAMQNILLACMIRGLGACPTSLHSYYEKEVKELLGVPESFRTCCIVTIGHTEKKYGSTRRIPSCQKTHWERWDAQKEWEPKTRA